jgi:hypothetical protein
MTSNKQVSVNGPNDNPVARLPPDRNIERQDSSEISSTKYYSETGRDVGLLYNWRQMGTNVYPANHEDCTRLLAIHLYSRMPPMVSSRVVR